MSPPSCFERSGSFLEREESLPRDRGRTVGNSSIFFNEFFLMIVGLRSVLLASASRHPTKAYILRNSGLIS